MALIVRLIFGYAQRSCIRTISADGWKKKTRPTWWNWERGLRNTRTKWEKKDPENGRYSGTLRYQRPFGESRPPGRLLPRKKTTASKSARLKEAEDWIVVEEKHEPLINHA